MLAQISTMGTVMSLCLLGQKPIHVSIYAPTEFPDEDVLQLLVTYGMLKSLHLCCLYLKGKGFEKPLVQTALQVLPVIHQNSPVELVDYKPDLRGHNLSFKLKHYNNLVGDFNTGFD